MKDPMQNKSTGCVIEKLHFSFVDERGGWHADNAGRDWHGLQTVYHGLTTTADDHTD